MLQSSLIELCGQLTFIEAFDRTGATLLHKLTVLHVLAFDHAHKGTTARNSSPCLSRNIHLLRTWAGRVLNITVTRSDGRAPALLCNYLTTPHLLVYSASLASCTIPGVFEPVTASGAHACLSTHLLPEFVLVAVAVLVKAT